MKLGQSLADPPKNERNSSCREDSVKGLERVDRLLSECALNQGSLAVFVVEWDRSGLLHRCDYEVISFG